MIHACLLAAVVASPIVRPSDVSQFEFPGGTLPELAKVTANHAPQAAFVGQGPTRLRAVSFRFSTPTELDTELRRYFGFGPLPTKAAEPSFVFIASELTRDELRAFGFPAKDRSPSPDTQARGTNRPQMRSNRSGGSGFGNGTVRNIVQSGDSVDASKNEIHWFVGNLPVTLAKSPATPETVRALRTALSAEDAALDWAQWRPRMLAGARAARREAKVATDQARIDVWIALITDTAVADLEAAFQSPNFQQEITPRQGTNAYRAAVNLNLAKLRESNQAVPRSFQSPTYRIRLTGTGIQVVSRDPVSGTETIL
jgi:hypothetical protein